MPRAIRLLLILTLASAFVLVTGHAPEASAHALLVKADPPLNAQLREPPTVLTLYFSEALERKFTGARVLDQNRVRVDDRVEFDDSDNALMRVYLKTVTPGFLTVQWETVSAVDGHRLTGSYPLTVLNPDGSQPPGTPSAAGVQTAGDEAKPGRVITKAALLIAGAALTGVFGFLVLVTPALPGPEGERARSALERRALYVAALAMLVLVIAGLAELLLQASDLNSSVGEALATRWGGRWLLRNLWLIAPAAATALLLVPGTGNGARRFFALVALLACGGYLALVSSVSHSAAGGGSLWAATSDFVHLLAASVWIGLLAMMALLFLWSRSGLQRGEKYGVLSVALARFSSIAVLSVALLLFTGVINSVVEVGRLDDLLNTGYGRALLVKLLLLLPLLALGGVNAYILRPRFAEAEGEQRSHQEAVAELETRLGKTVRYELAVAVAVLAVVAVLVQLSPTRGRLSTPDQQGQFIATKTDKSGIGATLIIDPNQPGINSFEVDISGPTNTVQSMRLDFRQGGDAASESRLDLEASPSNVYFVGKGPYLGQAGKWTVVVDIRRTQDSDIAIPFALTVPGPAGQTSSSRSGSALASPLPSSAEGYALVAVTGVLALALVAASFRPAGLTGGYMSELAEILAARIDLRRSRPLVSLAALIVIGVGIGLILGSHVHQKVSPQQATKGNPIASSPQSIDRGRVLFSQNCTQCHGETGRGDGPLAKSLPIPPANLYDHIPYHPDQFFFQVLSNGLGGVMPGFSSQISEEDRWNILNFLRSQFGQPPAAQ